MSWLGMMPRTMRVPLWIALCLLFAACVKRADVGDSHVGRGELYKTGNASYDEFFEDVHGLQADAKTIEEEQKKALGPVAQALGVSEPAPDRLIDLIRERASKLAESKKGKVALTLEGIDEQGRAQPGKAIVVAAAQGQTLPKEAQDFVAALDASAKAEGRMVDRVAPLAEKAKKRSAIADSLLKSTEQEFVSREKRAEVKRELEVSKDLLAGIAQRSEQAADSAAKFLRETQQSLAAATDAKGAARAKPPSKPTAVKPSRPSPKEPAASGAATSKPPPRPDETKPASPAPAEGASDFNP